MLSIPVDENKRSRWPRSRTIVVVFAFLALLSVCLEYGFDQPLLPEWLLVVIQLSAVAAYLIVMVSSVIAAPERWPAIKKQWADVVFVAIALIVFLVEYEAFREHILKAGMVYVGTLQVLLVLRFIAGVIRWNLEMSTRNLHPARMLVVSFVIVIFVGGCLLALPAAVTPELRAHSSIPVRILQSFFTATSATCVTGLAVCDTGTDFTRFGQIVILILIQLGGLGIMISSTLFGVLIGKRLSLRQSLVLQDATSSQTIGRMRSVIRFIVIATFLIEAVGAVLSYPMFATVGGTFGNRLFFSVFHSISAFCNAGFSLHSDSLSGYGRCWGLYISVMPLITLGGLGFPVLQELYGWLKFKLQTLKRGRDTSGLLPAGANGQAVVYRFKLHTKLVLISSLALVVIPAILFFTFESVSNTAAVVDQPDGPAVVMRDMPIPARAGAALFMSVTARTAGFNTAAMDENSLSSASHFLLMLLMFVGGSPASTAGGVKTVAIAVLVLGVVATLRGRDNVEAFGRTLPMRTVKQASVVVMLMTAVVSLATLVLCVTESAPFRSIVFETISACGTVGLSTGITGQLSEIGQVVIILAMFAGRLGPLTVMIALAGDKSPVRYEYPDENVTIG